MSAEVGSNAGGDDVDTDAHTAIPGPETPGPENTAEPDAAERDATANEQAEAEDTVSEPGQPSHPPTPTSTDHPAATDTSPPPATPAPPTTTTTVPSTKPPSKPEKQIPYLYWLVVGGTGPPPTQKNFVRMAKERNAERKEQEARAAARKRALKERREYLAGWEKEWGPVGVVGLVTKVLGSNRRKKGQD